MKVISLTVLPVFPKVRACLQVQLFSWSWCIGCSETPSPARDAECRCTPRGICLLCGFCLQKENISGFVSRGLLPPRKKIEKDLKRKNVVILRSFSREISTDLRVSCVFWNSAEYNSPWDRNKFLRFFASPVKKLIIPTLLLTWGRQFENRERMC